MAHRRRREASRQQGCHASIVHGQHRYREPAVDLVGEVRDAQVVVEGGELRVLGKDLRYVEPTAQRSA